MRKGGIFIVGVKKFNVIKTAIKSEDMNARQTARTLVNRLGERGYTEFRDLLYQ